jgi:transcriptional regulator with XRE-family HTH domain
MPAARQLSRAADHPAGAGSDDSTVSAGIAATVPAGRHPDLAADSCVHEMGRSARCCLVRARSPGKDEQRRHPHPQRMDAAAVLRDARRRAGLSVRGAAQRCDVPRATWAGWESGETSPSARKLDAVLEALALDLRLIPRPVEPPGEQAVRSHLRLSLSDRARGALGCLLAEVADACRGHPRLLTGAAAVGVWVPDVVASAPLPLPAGSAEAGLVALRLDVAYDHQGRSVAFVPPPTQLISATLIAGGRALLTAARLLDEQAPLDGGPPSACAPGPGRGAGRARPGTDSDLGRPRPRARHGVGQSGLAPGRARHPRRRPGAQGLPSPTPALSAWQADAQPSAPCLADGTVAATGRPLQAATADRRDVAPGPCAPPRRTTRRGPARG